MKFNIKNQEVELKYSFNSFKYMEELDLSALEELESKPFKVIGVLEMLLMGAVNHSPKVKYEVEDVQEGLEKYIENEPVGDLLEKLMQLLQESNFFKSLQKNQEK